MVPITLLANCRLTLASPVLKSDTPGFHLSPGLCLWTLHFPSLSPSLPERQVEGDMSTQAVLRAGPTHVQPITRSLNVSCVWSLSLLLRLGLESVSFLPRVGWTVPPEPCVPQAWNLRTCYLAGPKRLCSCDKGPTSGWGGCLGWSRRARSRQPPKEDKEGKRVQRGPGGAGGPPTDFWLWSHRAGGQPAGMRAQP